MCTYIRTVLEDGEKRKKRYTHSTYLRSKNDRAVTAGMCKAYTHRGHVASGSAILEITILALTLPPYNGNAIRWCTVRKPYRLVSFFFSFFFFFLSLCRVTIQQVKGRRFNRNLTNALYSSNTKDVSGSYIYIYIYSSRREGGTSNSARREMSERCISEVTARPHRVTM